MALVETTRTKPTIAEFCAALREAAPSLSREAVGIIWAQFAAETGRGQNCWCWNIGNVRWSGEGDYCILHAAWEIVDGKRVVMPDASSKFRAFASLDEGMREHIEFLSTKRYAAVWPVVERGDPAGFAAALKARGYYTAPLAQYTASMVSLHAEFLRAAPAWDGAAAEPEVELVDGAIVLPELVIFGRPWVQVECDGELWEVAPDYVYPVSIGEAVQMAADAGCELPTPALVDAIRRDADLRVAPLPQTFVHWTQAEMDSPAAHARQRAALEKQLAGKSYRLLSGTHKDVVNIDGKPGIYGWHQLDGRPIQAPTTKHGLFWRDYSHGLRLCRRVGRVPADETPQAA